MKNNKVIIAAAGSGKTSLLINEALQAGSEEVLISTFTNANEAEIRRKMIKKQGMIPKNVTIKTWYSLLLQHGVKPFQNYLYENEIKGMVLVAGQSALYSKQKDVQKHYLTSENKIYSDKISKFSVRCNEICSGKVIQRIGRIYRHIFIDEVQDLSGFDLEFLKLLFDSDIRILLVGDPRQGTYSTANSPKHKQFKKSEIASFFMTMQNKLEIDTSSLGINYRSNSQICDLSNKLFPEEPATISGNSETTGHDGVFMVASSDVTNYLDKYPNSVQLRHSRRDKKVNTSYSVMNFGGSKGLSFDRVLIFPTRPMVNWLRDHNFNMQLESRSKFYVAVTRAKYSVAFVYEGKECDIRSFPKYSPK